MSDNQRYQFLSPEKHKYVKPIRATLLVMGIALFSGVSALAQGAFPNRAVKLVVPFSPGGATDMLGRIVADRLAAVWNQPVVVDNRAGASGTIGSDAVAKSKNDGYTILLGTASTHAVAQTLRPSLSYNVERDFAPISEVATSPLVLLVHPSLPAKSVSELVAYAKTQAGSIPYDGSPGTAAHMAMELLAARAGTKMLPIGYKGSSVAMIDLVGGSLQVAFNDVPPAVPFINNGQLRALAVTSPKRIPLLPQVPTVAESGYPGYDADVWLGLFAPVGTPPEIVSKIAADLKTALTEPAARKKLEEAGFTLVASSPSEFTIRVRNDIQKWRKVITDAGIKIE